MVHVENGYEKISHEAGARLGELTSHLIESTSQYVTGGRSFVKEKPATTLLMVAAAGFVAGSLLTLAFTPKKHDQQQS